MDYEMKLLKEHDVQSQNVTITFKSAATGQTENMMVSVKTEESQRDNNVLLKPDVCAPPQESSSTSRTKGSLQDVFYGTGSWLLLYSGLIATVIMILLVYHNMTKRPTMYPLNEWDKPAGAPLYYEYRQKDHGSPDPDIRTAYKRRVSPFQRSTSPFTVGQERHARSFYESPSTTPGSRTLFSVEQ